MYQNRKNKSRKRIYFKNSYFFHLKADHVSSFFKFKTISRKSDGQDFYIIRDICARVFSCFISKYYKRQTRNSKAILKRFLKNTVWDPHNSMENILNSMRKHEKILKGMVWYMWRYWEIISQKNLVIKFCHHEHQQAWRNFLVL